MSSVDWSSPSSSAASSGSMSSAQTSSKGSLRVRQERGSRRDEGSGPDLYLYALRSLMPAASAATCMVFPSANCCLRSLTCPSVTTSLREAGPVADPWVTQHRRSPQVVAALQAIDSYPLYDQ